MNTSVNAEAVDPVWLQMVRQQVGSRRFGIVQIVVHDFRVVWIERTEKVRLAKADSEESPTN